jgi:hypothetical protein
MFKKAILRSSRTYGAAGDEIQMTASGVQFTPLPE